MISDLAACREAPQTNVFQREALRIPGRANRAPAQAETEELRHSLPAQKFMQLNIFRREFKVRELMQTGAVSVTLFNALRLTLKNIGLQE